jgi:membrane-associated phospholipid phosphatase
VWPVFVDALFLAGLVHGDTDSMLQMALIDIEVLAIAHLVHWFTTRVVGRVRPLHRECVVDDSCPDRGVGPVASFVSGHSLLAYAASGLVCTHHIFNPWLTRSADGAAIACTSSLVLATTTSLMRVMVDLHWASDVGIGAVIGASLGWVLPIALHYAHGPPSPSAAREAAPVSLAVRPGVADELSGLTITGAF